MDPILQEVAKYGIFALLFTVLFWLSWQANAAREDKLSKALDLAHERIYTLGQQCIATNIEQTKVVGSMQISVDQNTASLNRFTEMLSKKDSGLHDKIDELLEGVKRG